jgi:hypothetical protein
MLLVVLAASMPKNGPISEGAHCLYFLLGAVYCCFADFKIPSYLSVAACIFNTVFSSMTGQAKLRCSESMAYGQLARKKNISMHKFFGVASYTNTLYKCQTEIIAVYALQDDNNPLLQLMQN